jgi:hypothetical protein
MAAMDKGKFLMAAKRFRRGAHIEYIISLDADDISQGNRAYVGKLRYFHATHSLLIPSSESCKRFFSYRQG